MSHRFAGLSRLGPVLALGAMCATLAACASADPTQGGDGWNGSASGSGGSTGVSSSSSGGSGSGPSSGSGSHSSSGSTSGSSSGTGFGSSSGSGGGVASGSSSGSSGNTGSGSGSSSGSSGSSGSGSSSGSSGSGSGSTSGSGGNVWQPSASAPIHFHWMIGGNGFSSGDILPNQSGLAVYDIDGENSTAADVAAIHAAGAIAVCYVDVGTLESGRSDYNQFPSSVVGPPVQGWPGENWLLVTAANQQVILPLMEARFKNWCQAKGFDAIEPDNLDAFNNGVTVSQTDNLAYDLAIGQLAHSISMSIGLKNLMTDLSASQYPTFLSNFDFAINEQCYEYSECDAYTAAGSFIPAGKAVFDVEYNVSPDCSNANGAHLNAQKTDLDLVGATESGYVYTPCVPDSQSTW